MATSSVKLRDGEKSIAAYLKSLPKGQREIAEALHALIMKTAPKAEVAIKWGYPWYNLDGADFAYLAGVAKRINFGFPRGAELESELLEGTGKGMRHIKVSSLDDIQPRAFASLLKAAARLPKAEAKVEKKAVTKSLSVKATAKTVMKQAARTNGAHGYTIDSLMAEMKKLGTAQAVKIYKRHGMVEPLFGVSFANLGVLKKQIKVDHDLAQKLWASGNGDARNLAVMIADPAKFTSKQVDAWAKDQDGYGSCDMLSGLIGKTAFAQEKAEAWIKSKDEWIGRTGWNLIGGLAMNQENKLPDSYFEQMLGKIEKEIHGAKNFTRHAMNMTLICIGARSVNLRKKAEAAAGRIGKVVVDHGETDCKTPAAIPYIEKMWARKKK